MPRLTGDCGCGCGRRIYLDAGPQYIENGSGCWEWQRAKDPRGYGVMNGGNNRRVFAHRHFYEGLRGPIPNGLDLDHSCGNPSCVNPNHLEPVPHSENVYRGRQSKLTAQDVLAMRELLANGTMTLRQAAERYGVSRHQAWMIKARRSWCDLPE